MKAQNELERYKVSIYVYYYNQIKCILCKNENAALRVHIEQLKQKITVF